MNSFNAYSIVPLTTSALLAVLGLFCFSRNHASRIHQLFALLCASVVPWPFALGVFLNLTHPKDIMWWTQVGHVTCTLAPAFFLDFVTTLLGLTRWRRLVHGLYLYATITIIASFITPWYFKPEVFWYTWGPYAKTRWLVIVDALLGCVVVVTAFILLSRATRRARLHTSVDDYNRLRYLTLALGFFSFGLLDYLPKFGVPIIPCGSLFILTFALIVTFAIIKHQLLDFTLAVRRTAVYSILAAFITASYIVGVLIMEKLFQDVLGYRSLVATSIMGFIIALGFTPLKNYIQAFVDRYFFRGSPTVLAAQNEELRKEIQQTERLKAVATLAAGMAHEIKNPLASIKTFVEYLPQRYEDPVFREKFSKIVGEEVDRMNTFVHRLLEFSKPTLPHLRPLRVSRVASETLDFLHSLCMQKQIQLTTNFTDNDEVLADPGQLKQIFLNILLNSIEAMERPGHIRVSTIQENGHLDIIVADTGRGISPINLKRIFDPFYTTKLKGTGLGLSVVHGIVREHGGKITVESELEQGTIVRLSFPLAR